MELLAIVPVEMLKVAVVAEAAMVTDWGTVSEELEFTRLTVAPPAGAAWDSVSVQILEAFDASVLGVQVNEDSDAGATRLRVTLEELPL